MLLSSAVQGPGQELPTTLQILKKLVSVGSVTSRSDRLNIRDNTGIDFLIDTGSHISVLPITKTKPRPQPAKQILYAANNTEIATYGTVHLDTSLGLRRALPWNFTIADVDRAIIGCDFLDHYNILVDIRNKRLIDGETKLTAPANLATGLHVSILTLPTTTEPWLRELLDQFPEIATPRVQSKPASTQAQHVIISHGPPPTCRPRRLTGDKLHAAQIHFKTLMAQGIVRPSSSSYASPIHLVSKGNNQYRVTGDYRAVNHQTVPDSYPVPYLNDFQNILDGTTIYSKLDLLAAFHQIEMHPDSIPKTAVATPFGLFEYTRMPYGLRNASQTQQRIMNEIFRDLEFVFIFIDDFLIASKTPEEHRRHLEIVLGRLRDHGLALNLSKCEFAKTTIDFLGHTISAAGIKPMAEKVQVITDYPKPSTIASLKRFLGMINFYRRFLKGAATYLEQLDVLAITKRKNDPTPVAWTPAAEAAFSRAKEEIANATLLAHPSPNKQLYLHVDASDRAVGGALHQDSELGLQPLGFFSKRLSETKQRYSTYDRELEAIFQGVRHFKEDIEGRNVITYTDHKPLTFAMTKSDKCTNQRQARQLELISQYCTDIRHIPGEENFTADALSRIESITAAHPVSQAELAEAQKGDDELKEYLQGKKQSSMKLENIDDAFGTVLTCDTTTNRPRPFVPVNLRQRIIGQLHAGAHPGVAATTRLVSTNFIWPNMSDECKYYVNHCMPCQKSKVSKHTRAPLHTPVPPNGRFRELNVDIIGPYPVSQGNRFCLTVIDRFSRWPAAIPMVDATASSVSKALLEGWIQHCGVPQKITTDRGRQFESTLFKELNQALGTTHLVTTAYRPQANGMIERWHRTLKGAIKCLTETDWALAVPLVVLALRNTLKEDLQATPAELVYGESLKIPGSYFDETTLQPTSEFVQQMQHHFANIRVPDTRHHALQKIFVPRQLATCNWILLRTDAVRRPFQPPYEGPYKVIARNDRTLIILKKGKKETVSLDRTKPALVYEEKEEESDNPNVTTNQLRNPDPDTTTTYTFPTTIPGTIIEPAPAAHPEPVRNRLVRIREPPPSRIPVMRPRPPARPATTSSASSTRTTRSGRAVRRPTFHYH